MKKLLSIVAALLFGFGAMAQFSAVPATTEFNEKGGTISIVITSDIDWIAYTTGNNAISISPQQGKAGTITGTITVEPNRTVDVRMLGVKFCEAFGYGATLAALEMVQAGTKEIVYGCTDSEANNYNPKANTDDGSCEYPPFSAIPATTEFGEKGGTTSVVITSSVDWIAYTDNDAISIKPPQGKAGTTIATITVEPNRTTNVRTFSVKFRHFVNSNYGVTLTALEIIQAPTRDTIYGCTDKYAKNYNRNATVDDYSCTYDIYGCMDETAVNYYPKANIDNESCYYAEILGCRFPNALNYNANATVEDGSCIFIQKIWGCTDKNAVNYSANANADNGRCEYATIVYGCTDRSALNFDPAANRNNNSCKYAQNSLYGCMNPAALNYNPYATIANNSCVFNTIAQKTIEGCTDTLALNFNVVATKDNESCIYQAVEIAGCMQPMALNFNEKASVDDNSCVFANPDNVNMFVSEEEAVAAAQIFSYIVKNACDFDFSTPIDTAYIAHLKVRDNGTYLATWVVEQGKKAHIIQTVYSEKSENAVYYLSLICNSTASWLKADDEVQAVTIGVLFKGDNIISGCMDKTAENYNKLANENDKNSCIFTAINAVEDTDMVVYPNPTAGMVYVSAASEIKVYNSFGALVIATHGTQVDLSNFANGVYVVQVNGKRTTVVKNN